MRRLLVPVLTVAPLLLVGAGLWGWLGWQAAAIVVGALWWFDDAPGAK